MEKKLPLKSTVLAGAFVGLVAFAGSAAAADSIQISFGSYGYAMDRKTVTDDIKKACEGKESCVFLVKNEFFTGGQPADPSPGNDKGLMVGWKCGANDHKEQFAEGRKAHIGCK